ncbi:uncharacterized protein [Battus philenor]|uniref:uncharacterized protein n=1 Tax=Battus philenor TaxID=42288 RepID=UPI0035CF3EA9
MASVHIFNTFQCAGSIVKSDLVITASSCLQLAWNNRFYRENPAFLSVRVGSSFYNGGGENIPVLEIYFHPDYNPKNLWNNVCLLRLLRHVRFLKKTRKSVKKIAIDKHPWSLPTNTPGITIIGWGAKGRSNTLADPWVNILSFAMLDVYPLRECQEVYSKEYVTRNNFCGGFFAKGSGACNRDVGAPGVVDGVLVGVVSFGSPVCGTPDAPTVFTKLGYYYSWIQTIMKLKIPRTKKKSTPRLDPDPLGPYRTTKITTTTFRIEPLEEGELPISVTDERDPDSFLRTLDDKLFLEFLETMFGGKEVKKYENLLKQKAKILRDPSINTTTKEQTTEPNEQGREARTELFIPEEFESDIPHTQLIPFENTAVTEEYTQVTDDSDERDARNKNFYNPTQKHKPNIKRNKHKGKHIKKIPTTLETPREIFLELATESSDDSDQSLPLQSGINLVLSKESSDKSSSEDSDISGEQVIADLLDEIDLNEILKEATASTISSKSFQNYGKRDSVRNRYVAPITTDVPQTYNYNKKLPNKVSKGKIKTVNDKKDSILTLLYLTDSEKKHNTNSYVGNVRVERSNTPFTATTECNGCSKVYNIVPKSEIYKIISRVLKAAIVNKA